MTGGVESPRPRAEGREEGAAVLREVEVVGTEAVEAALSRQYAGAVHLLPTSSASGRMRLSTIDLGAARLDRVRFDMAFGASGPTLGGLVVAVVRRGRFRSTWRGEDRDYLPGDVCLTVQQGVPFSVEHHETEFDVVMIGPELLREVAAGAGARAGGEVRFTAPAPLSPQHARRWRSTVGALRDQSVAAGAAGSHPLVSAAAGRLLAATALATFANTAVGDGSTPEMTAAAPRVLRRAMAYIDEHAAGDVSLADVAAACHVSVRALQLAFRRHLGTTPSAYLRRMRLEGVRRELRERDAEETTVTEVAARWGFAHPGRFAASYRDAFAELPSRTLRG